MGKKALVNIIKQSFIHSKLHTRDQSGRLLKFFKQWPGKSCYQTTNLHCLLYPLNITISYSRLCINGLSAENRDAWQGPEQTAKCLHPSKKSTWSLLKLTVAKPFVMAPCLINLNFWKYFSKVWKDICKSHHHNIPKEVKDQGIISTFRGLVSFYKLSSPQSKFSYYSLESVFPSPVIYLLK